MKFSHLTVILALVLSLTAPGVALADTRSDFARALRAIEQQDYAGALSILDGVETGGDLAPADQESILLYRARLSAAQGGVGGAIEALEAAAKAYPESARPYHQLATLYQRDARYEDAAKAYATAIEKPENADNPLVLKLDYGWFLATCPDGKYRDGARAVSFAEEMLKSFAAQKHDPLPGTLFALQIFEVLAAAQAEAVAFDKAVAAASLASNFRASLHKVLPATEFAKKDFDARLAGYKAGKPWRDPAP
jgi:tetratricopeptide (TPR) repeat protein